MIISGYIQDFFPPLGYKRGETKEHDMKISSQRALLVLATLILFLGFQSTIDSKWFHVDTYTNGLRNMTNNWQKLFTKKDTKPSYQLAPESMKVVQEESTIINVVDTVSPSVVTVGISKTQRLGSMFEINPFDPFSPFQPRNQGRTQKIEQDIGSGFIVSSDGLIVTNRHVVSDTEAKYRVILNDDKTYDVEKIYRDPSNDLAVLKIAASGLTPVTLGDSANIKVGQLAIAIGTALGEFRHTVTTGVISGIGRGITAGTSFEGTERLENVIQTDAAINPGNSGGPLLNSSGHVIGVNTAVSAEGQNIGFAIPINVVKDALDNFNQTGQFNRAFMGVQYRFITKELGILNDVPEGAYVLSVVDGSPAAKGGLQEGDIITKFDSVRLTSQSGELSELIGKKKPGDNVRLDVYRDAKEVSLTITLGTQDSQ